MERLTSPTLFIGGWPDPATRAMVAALRRDRSSPAHRLVVGPWTFRDLSAPAAARGNSAPAALFPLLASWFASHLAPDEHPDVVTALGPSTPVWLYVAGLGEWLALPSLPDDGRLTMRRWYLGVHGDAASGPRSLDAEPVAESSRDVIVDSPSGPGDTTGLAYTTPPMAQDIVIAGEPRVTLWVASGGERADFGVQLADVGPDGESTTIDEGVRRVDFSHDALRTRTANVADAVEIGLALPPIAWCVRRGHAIRLRLSGSSFPRFDRLPKSSGMSGQLVFHGGATPSRLDLPVVPDYARHQRWGLAALGPGGEPNGPLAALLAPVRGRRVERVVFRIARYVLPRLDAPKGVLAWLLGTTLSIFNREVYRWSVATLDVAADHRALEIGCGAGRALEQLAKVAVRGFVAGIDPSDGMRRAARRRNARAVRDGRVEIRQGSAGALPYDAASFDRVLAIASISVWPDKNKGLREVMRVLRPGGRVVFADHFTNWTPPAVVEQTARQIAMLVRAAGFADVKTSFTTTRFGRAMCVAASGRRDGTDPVARPARASE